MKLIDVVPLETGKHKFKAVFSDGTTTKFGSKNSEDYTTHHDPKRRDNYRKRHEKDLRTGDPTRPGFLSYYISWGDSTSLVKNIYDFKKKFDL